MKKLKGNYNNKLNGVTIYTDSEFGSKPVRQYLSDNLSSELVIEHYEPSKDQISFTKEDLNIRNTIKRVIGRLEVNFSLEHPRILGRKCVAIHTQLCILCDQLLVLFNLCSGNHSSLTHFVRFGEIFFEYPLIKNIFLFALCLNSR